jgi:hypothetical protein
MAGTWMAEQRLVFVYPDGRRVAGRIAIGLPTITSEREASCVLVFEGLQPQHLTMRGASQFQAMTLGLQFLALQLRVFCRDGGRVLYSDAPDDEDYPLQAIFLGLLNDPFASQG